MNIYFLIEKFLPELIRSHSIHHTVIFVITLFHLKNKQALPMKNDAIFFSSTVVNKFQFNFTTLRYVQLASMSKNLKPTA
jgi:hypothetical protein